MTEKLFEGLKVLDAGSWIAGPVAGTILADFGAEVTKVEMPGAGDGYRILSGLPGYPDAASNYMWQLDARNKKSLSLNLKTDEGMAIFHRLVADCDVYITNQPFPMRNALGLNYEDLKPLNPTMIYASLTAYGEKGPDRDKEGFDLVAYWARSGLMDIVRAPGAMPAQAVPGMGDHPSAVTLYASIVTALLKREKTGEGSMVHTSLMANGLWSASCIAQAGFSAGSYEGFRTLRRERRFTSTVFETRDGRFLQFTMVRTEEELDTFLSGIDLPGALSDERFSTPEGRFANSVAFTSLVADQIIERDADDWLHHFSGLGVPVVLVGTVEELVNDQQIYENDMVVAPEDPSVQSPHVIRHPLNIEGLATAGVQRAPEVGEHNAEILAKLGYDAAEIARLHENGII